MTNDVIFEEMSGPDGVVGCMTLNRPNVLNALNQAMFVAMNQQLKNWAHAKHIKAVIICAAPGKAFCAGGDIRHAYELGQTNRKELPNFFSEEYQLNRQIFHYPKPYIALLNGITMGGGAGISLHGSHRVATEQCVFAMPETAIGFFPDVGASYFLSRLPDGMGVYLGLTGARIQAADCLALGLVDQVVPSQVLPDLTKAIVETPFEKNASKSITDIIHSFSVGNHKSTLMEHQEKIRRYFSRSTVEEIILALLSDATPWSQETAASLKKKSPMSLKVTLKEIQKGKSLDFDACMEMEYQLMLHFIKSHDFYEGVRAVIIDKDQNPKWQPATLEAVSAESVDRYFD